MIRKLSKHIGVVQSSMACWLSPGENGQVFADPIVGQTLIAREPFDTDLDSGTPGAFTGGVTGAIAGGMTCGPNWATHPVRGSGGMRYPETSELTVSSTFFRGDFLVDNAGAAQSCMIGGWFRFGAGTNMGQLRELLSYHLGYAPIGIFAQWSAINPTKISLGCGYGFGNEFGGPVEINCHQWYWLALAITWSGTTMRIKAGYMANGGTTLTEFGDSGDRTEAFNPATFKAYFNHSITGFQGSLSGRVAALSFYWITTMGVGLTYPAEIAHPVEERTVYRLDQVNGNDSNVNGPWLTDTGVENARKKAVFKGAYIPWKFAGIDASYAATSNASERIFWGIGFRTDPDQIVPQGDILEIASGDHFLTQGLNFEFVCPGITIRGASQSDPPTLYMDAVLAGVTWTDEGNRRWEGTGATNGIVRGGIWLRTDDDANGRIQRLPLYAVRNATQATAEALLETYTNGAYWTNDAPTTIGISVDGGADPNELEYHIAIALTHTHAIIIGDGLVRDIRVAGGLQYTTDGSDQLFARYHFAMLGNSTVGQISVFHRCVSKEYGKHGFAFVTGNPTHLAVRLACETRSGPINTPETDVGFWTGAWSAFVDFSGAPTQAADGTGSICLNYELVDVDNRCQVGNVTPAQDAAVTAYLSHNAGGVNQFAFIGVYDQNFTNPNTAWFSAGNAWQDAVPHW